jgi:hypothetical protein
VDSLSRLAAAGNSALRFGLSSRRNLSRLSGTACMIAESQRPARSAEKLLEHVSVMCDQCFDTLGVLPPHHQRVYARLRRAMRGRVGEGGGGDEARSLPHLGTPTPNPSPPQVGPARLAHDNAKPGQARVSWGGEHTEFVAPLCLNLTGIMPLQPKPSTGTLR